MKNVCSMAILSAKVVKAKVEVTYLRKVTKNTVDVIRKRKILMDPFYFSLIECNYCHRCGTMVNCDQKDLVSYKYKDGKDSSLSEKV